MTKAKTAISIDSLLLDETDVLAKELDIPRSQIISDAISDYLQQYRNKELLAKINAACSAELDEEDVNAMKIIRSHQKKQGQLEEWK